MHLSRCMFTHFVQKHYTHTSYTHSCALSLSEQFSYVMVLKEVKVVGAMVHIAMRIKGEKICFKSMPLDTR